MSIQNDLHLRPITDEEHKKALAFLRRNNATDLADMLGLTKEH